MAKFRSVEVQSNGIPVAFSKLRESACWRQNHESITPRSSKYRVICLSRSLGICCLQSMSSRTYPAHKSLRERSCADMTSFGILVIGGDIVSNSSGFSGRGSALGACCGRNGMSGPCGGADELPVTMYSTAPCKLAPNTRDASLQSFSWNPIPVNESKVACCASVNCKESVIVPGERGGFKCAQNV